MRQRPSPVLIVAALAALAGGLWYAQQPAQPANPWCPDGKCPLVPVPVPVPQPRPWRAEEAAVAALTPGGGGRAVVGGRSYEGEELSADLPGSEHIKNIGSQVDGAGMCVTSSIEMAALWHGLEQMRGLRDWCARQPGGAYPQKVDQQIKAFCAAKGIPVPPYVQYEGTDPGPIMDLADRTRRMLCSTYGTSERYGGRTIAHMVCVPKAAGRYGCVLDNNFPGESQYEWILPREELVRRMKYPRGTCWLFCWLAPAPPLPPFN